MKKLTLISFCLVSLFIQTNFGQSGSFCSFSTQTTNEGDYFKYTYNWPSQPCIRDSFLISQINDTCFQVDLYYTIGEAASPCSGTDSVLIADVPDIQYTVLLTYFYTDFSGSDCYTTTKNTDDDSFRIFPNPSFGILTISGLQIGSEITINNMLGQIILVTKITMPEEIIDITHLSYGTYFLSVKNSINGKYSEVLLIKR